MQPKDHMSVGDAYLLSLSFGPETTSNRPTPSQCSLALSHQDLGGPVPETHHLHKEQRWEPKAWAKAPEPPA